jgi:energy-coupling factor transporter transmembrane protein EcfT
MPFHIGPTNGEKKHRGAFSSLDPRFLIAGFALIVISAFVVPGTWGLLVVLVYVLALHRLAGLPPRSLVKAVRVVGPFIILIVAVNAILVEGEPIAHSVRFITREGVTSGIRAGVRVLVLYSSMAVFLALVRGEDVARGVCALVTPVSPALARRIALYAFLTVGFLPLFADEIGRIEVAQRFRGGGLGGGFSSKLNGARLLVVPLVLSAIRRSDQLAMTVELRRIRSRIERILVLEETSAKDYVFVVVTLGVLAGAYAAF